jgi:outer membrane protein assembly factor BamB
MKKVSRSFLKKRTKKLLLRCRGLATAALLLSSLALASSADARPETTLSIDWPTFGLNAQRNNYNPTETALSVSTVPGLTQLWRQGVGNTKYQPSLVRGVSTAKGTADLLISTSPDGIVVALNAATGKVVWSTTFPLTSITCNGATRTAGIGEPATIDVPNGRLFVVDAGGKLHALALATGAELSGYPVEIIDSANLAAGTWVHYASPTLVGSTIYFATAAFGLCESSAVPYHGQVISFDTIGQAVIGRYYPMGNGALLGGGLWGPGGVVADVNGSVLWGATANTLPPPQTGGNAEKVLQLDLNLNLLAANGPQLSAGGDYDFGSSPLLFTPAGCPEMLAAMNKAGIIVLYDTTRLTAGPVQTLAITPAGGGSKFIGMPSFDPVTNAVYIGNPQDLPGGPYYHGLIALRANAACQLALAWQQSVGPNGKKFAPPTPVIANGVVYYGESNLKTLAAFNAATGAPLWTSGKLAGTLRAAPIVVNGAVYVGAGRDIVAFGLTGNQK